MPEGTRPQNGQRLPEAHRAFATAVRPPDATLLEPRDFADFLNIRRGKIQRVRQLAVLLAAFTIAVRRWFWLTQTLHMPSGVYDGDMDNKDLPAAPGWPAGDYRLPKAI